MTPRTPSGWFSRNTPVASVRGRGLRRSPLRLAELEERVTPYNTFYSLGEGVDTIWNPNPLSYSYSNLLDGGIKNGATPLTYTELTTAVEEAMGAWTAVSGIAFYETADSGPSPAGLSGASDPGGDYDADGHPYLRWGHHAIDGDTGQNTVAHAERPGTGGLNGDIHFDSANSFNFKSFLEIATHEFGHAIGMAHANGDVVEGEPNPAPTGAIMDAVQGFYQFNGPGSSYLTADDIAGIRSLYHRGLGYVRTASGALHVYGTQGENVITVASAGGVLTVHSRNIGSFSVFTAGLTSINVHGHGGNDILRVEGNGGVLTNLYGDGGDDTFDFGYSGGDLDLIAGETRVFGGDQLDHIVLQDTTNDAGATYTVSVGHVDRAGFGGVGFPADVEKLTLTTGRPAYDTVRVPETALETPVYLNNGGGHDTVRVGNGNNGVESVRGTVFVNNTVSRGTTLEVDNAAGRIPRDAHLLYGSIQWLAPAGIVFDPAALDGLTVSTGLNPGVFVVSATGSGYTTTLNTSPGNDQVFVRSTGGPLTVNGGGGLDTVVIGDRVVAHTPPIPGGGTDGVNQIHGSVTLNNPDGLTDLIVDNRPNASPHSSVVITNRALTGLTWGTSAINYRAELLNSLTVYGGDGTNTFDVSGLTFAANLIGGSRTDRLISTNNFDFGLGDTVLRRNRFIGNIYQFYGDVGLTSIESAVLTGGSAANEFWFESWGGQITLNGGGGADRLLLDDALTAASTAYTVYDNRVTYPRNGKTVTVNYFNFADLTITGGTSPSTFDVESTAAATATTVNVGPGGGDVRVAPGGRTLDQLRGPLTVNGNGVTTLSLDDREAALFQGPVRTEASLFTQTDRNLILQRIRTDLLTNTPVHTVARVTYQNLAGLTVVAPRQTPNTVLSVLNTGGATRTILDTTGGAAQVVVGSPTTNPDAVGSVLILGSPSTSVVIDDTATVPSPIPVFGYNHKPTYLLGDGAVARTNVVTYSLPQFSFSSVTTYRTAINYGNIGSLEVRGGSTGNVFDVQVQGAANRHQTTLKAGSGADVVNAGGPDTGLDYVDRLTVVGNTGTVLNLNDQATGYRQLTTSSGTRTISPKPTFRVTNGTVSRTNVVTSNFLEFNFPSQQTFNTSINYSTLPQLVLNGGSNGNVFNVQYTAAGTPVVINAGAGDDITNVGYGNFMDGIQGPVTVNGQAGTNEVNLNDRGQQDGVGYFIGADAVIRDGVSPFLGFQGVQKLVLSAGRGADSVWVTGTTATTDVTVNAGGGNDAVFLGSGGNTLDPILRPVTVSGQGGTDRLVLQDDLSTVDHTYTVANTSVRRDAADVVAYTLVENLTLDAGRGNDQIIAASTFAGATTTLNGGDGNEQFVVQGPAANLDDIRGPLALHGQGGTLNYPILYDHQSTVGRTYTLTADRVRRSGMGDITFDNMIQLLLYTGHTAADTVNIESVAPGVFTPVVVGLGDVVTVGNPVTGGRSMQEIRGAVRVQAFNDEPVAVVLDNRADPLPHDTTFAFDPANVLNNFLTGLSPEPVNFILGPTSSLTIRGGTGADTFRLPTTAPGVPLTLEGGGGAGRNTLDYSASTADVTVNLRTATATGLAGFSGIQDVTGGTGADVLVGNGGNTLQGGPGRDILVAGTRASTLVGGTGEDVLVGGTTAHDLDPTALAAFQAEWARTDLPFAARVHDLTRGGGLNGTAILAPATFTPNGRVNTLTGAAPADLFFGSRALDAHDFNADQGDVFIEKTTVLGGTLIDARALDIASFTLDNVSYDATTPFTRTLTAGSHFVNTPYHGPAVFFTVAADGTIDYDPALEGALTGRGTANLGINGRAVTLDASALDAPFLHLDNGTFAATASLTRRLLPGQHFVNMPYNNPVLYFTVANDGTVDYAATLDGVFSGRSTTELTITGRTVTLDARILDVSSLHLDNVPYDATAPLIRQLLPGQHFINTPYVGPVVYFTVADDGTVDYAPALDGVFTGRGTSSLGITGREVRIDAEALGISWLHLDNVSYNSTTLTRRLLPGQHFLNTPYHGPVVYFTVAADGTVDYDAALDGVFTGRGTSDLGVDGRTVTIDATALGVATLFIDNVSYAAQDPLLRQLLPGQHFVTVTGVTYYFTVATDGSFDYAAELDSVLSGRGTTTLLFLNP
jgi:Ca2+-binding RTX toxin-like protein